MDNHTTGKKRLDHASDGREVYIDNVDDALKLFRKMHNASGLIACDTECYNLNRIYDNDMLSIQFSMDGHTGYVLPFNHPQSPFDGGEKETIAKAINHMFMTPTPNKVWWGFHNNQYDLHQIRRTFECEVLSGPVVDSMQMAYLLNENRIRGTRDPECYFQGEKGLSMAVLAKTFLDITVDEQDKKDRANMSRWAMDRFVKYSGKDSWITWRLIKSIESSAKKAKYWKQMRALMLYLFSPANLLVCEMEVNGFYLDLNHILRIKGASSPLIAEQKKLMSKLKQMDMAIKANHLLVSNKARGNKPIFGKTPWMWSPSKDAHRRVLFLDLLEYTPLSYTNADPPKPKIDTEFYEEYGVWSESGDPQNEAAIVGDWVGIEKMRTSFINNFHKLIDPDGGHPDMQPDGRVRTTIKMTGTTSGRPAAEKPAMHQIPRATNEWRKAVKNMFAVEEGDILIAADLSANEVRWAAIEAQCPDLGALFTDGVNAQKAFRKRANDLIGKDREMYIKVMELAMTAKYDGNKPQNNEAVVLDKIKKKYKTVADILEEEKTAKLRGDIHTQTASTFYEEELSAVSKSLRQDTKSIIFGHIAARGVKAIAAQIGKSEEETKKKIEGFDRKFPGLSAYLKRCRRNAERLGYVEGLQGRRRRFSAAIWSDPEEWIQAKARRQAQNNTIQGIASDACITAAFRLLDYIRKHNKSWKILNIVHDAVYMQVPLHELKEAVRAVELCLTKWTMHWMHKKFGINFNAPLEAEVEVGFSWGKTMTWNGTEPHLDLIYSIMLERFSEKYNKPYITLK